MITPPLSFIPILHTRIWGGQKLHSEFGIELPGPGTWGESWNIVDRGEFTSIVKDGPYAGQSLHQLWMEHRTELFGPGYEDYSRFPIISKTIDAADTLSVQVHPPTPIAASLNGESKDEVWYIANVEPDTKLYAGWKNHYSTDEIQRALETNTLEDYIHELSPEEGETLYIPSGRLHALGKGTVVFEIQENSDTTYRLFDWNRLDNHGHPRELHINKGLQSLDYEDIKPVLRENKPGVIAQSRNFTTQRIDLFKGETFAVLDNEHFTLVTIAEGTLEWEGLHYNRGQSLIIPVGCPAGKATENAIVLLTTLPLSEIRG